MDENDVDGHSAFSFTPCYPDGCGVTWSSDSVPIPAAIWHTYTLPSPSTTAPTPLPLQSAR